MHGRTREQMYTGHADLETLHKVAQVLTKIPFIANGDIRTVQDAKQRIEEVGGRYDWTRSYGKSLPLQSNQSLL
jgi:tRNA-dihydrouridine synthase